MSHQSLNSDVQWETEEQGWHAVATMANNSYQWTAYIEYIDAPFWRIWAGCLFENLQAAQTWCQHEIASQLQRVFTIEDCTGKNYEDAWCWLWHTLRLEVGETRSIAIREEFTRRLQLHANSNE